MYSNRVIGGRYLVSVVDGYWVVSDMMNYLTTVGRRHMSYKLACLQAEKLSPPQHGAQAPSPKGGAGPYTRPS